MLLRLIFTCTVALAAQAHAAEAGKVIFAAGATSIAARAAAEGAPVQEGELLTTGADGFLYVKTIDNGLFILRPNTKARIAVYQVDQRDPSNTHVKLELLSGVARSKSGDAVKLARQNFRFNTPVAAIGVRGTDFTVYTDADTSRIAVLTGRVVVAGFGGACTPEGGGPCEGASSRELSAAQRGQLLQVSRGQVAPQLMSGSAGAPDQVSPPRADEPLAKGGSSSDQAIEAKKSDSLDKKLAQQPSFPVTAPPPVVEVTPAPPTLAPIQWGRWQEIAGNAPTLALANTDPIERIIGGNFVLSRPAGQVYATPERGSVAFNLQNSEAYILYDDLGKSPTAAKVQNGLLSFNFDKSTFSTSFDLAAGAETFKMSSNGAVSPTGRFSTGTYDNVVNNMMQVDGVLSNASGGSAAYIFQHRLDDKRSTSGVTYWTK